MQKDAYQSNLRAYNETSEERPNEAQVPKSKLGRF